MGRLRNASRIWHDAAATASHIMVPCDGFYFTAGLAAWFSRRAPLELELGAGRGDFIIERAAAMPDRDFLAIESAPTIAQLMALRAQRRGVSNLRVARMDARALVNLMLPAATIDACHIYFPDPWPKERHAKHRLITPHFLASLARVLKLDAPLFIATDVAAYARRSFTMLSRAGFRPLSLDVPGASKTGFARKFISEGRPIHAGAFAAPVRAPNSD